MYNHDQIQTKLPWYETPVDFNQEHELMSGHRLHIEEIATISKKVKELDKYKEPATKCRKLRNLFYRKVDGRPPRVVMPMAEQQRM